MNERAPFIRPRIETVEAKVETQRPLESLEADQLKVESYDFFYDKVVRGEITTRSTLEAYAIGRYDSDGYLRDASNSYVSLPNGGVVRASGRNRELKPQEVQVELLSEYIQRQGEYRQLVECTRKEIVCLRTVIDVLAQTRGGISDAALEARLAGRYDSDGYLRDARNSYVSLPNGSVVRETNAQRRGDIENSEARVALQQLIDLLENVDIPKEIRANMRVFLSSGDDTILERMNQAALAQGVNAEYVGELTRISSQIEQRRRRQELTDTFFAKANLPGRFDESTRVLQQFEASSEVDRALVSRLTGYAFSKRRLEITARFVSMLQENPVNFSSALELLRVLSGSPSKEDTFAVTPLARQAYAFELAQFRQAAQDRLTRRADSQGVYDFIDLLPLRPSIDQYDYVATVTDMKAFARRVLAENQKVDRLAVANGIRVAFTSEQAADILKRLEAFPRETIEDQAIAAQLLDEYRQYAAASRPEEFDQAFGQELAAKLDEQKRGKFVQAELGRNKEAFRYTQRRFTEVIYPLEQVLRDDPRTKDSMAEILGERAGAQGGERSRYVLRLKQLSEQRSLTDVERAYLESVELLSLHNPYLVAAATSAPGVTKEFLNHHFDRKSRLTARELKDGDYVPALIIGSGPSGMIAFGELVRQRPDLAEQTILVDEGETIGGPFAIPRGPAWELNSANRRGAGGASLPDRPQGVEERETVRAYGSPVSRWYPGERAQKKDVRAGSINTTVDYLLTPDDLSTARYPTNEELQLTLSLQAALTVNKMMLGTRLRRCEPAPDDGKPGTKIATLEIRDENGETRTVKVRTDFIPTSSGLGEPTYGFSLPGSRAERVLEKSKGRKGFPKLSTTLEAFRALADRRLEKKSSIGKTLVIWGRGNSTDTLIEFIGNIFNGENPRVRDVTKIYVIAEGDLSARPRYAQITDLKPRNGRGNLVEFVRARVVDAGFVGEEESVSVYNERGSFLVILLLR